MSSEGNFYGAVAFGFGAGIFWFFKGFRIYRQYRVLADTPETPIRSIPMGFVEIHGKANGQETVESPVTKTTCHFYKVDIERWVTSKNGGHWSHAATDADGVKFYLEDASGKVLVDAHRAEYDLIKSGRRQTGSTSVSLGRLFRSSDDDDSSTGAWVSSEELISYADSVIAGKRSLFSGGNILSELTSGSLHISLGSSRRYRLTEYCILPGHWYDVTGTCAENPATQDEQDRHIIVKGENEPTFLISWRDEKGIEGRLRNRAALHIFGGAALAVVCLALLLSKLGWL